MLRQETLHVFGLVRRQVVEHYMNLLGPLGALDQAGQKRHELLRGMPRRGHAMHFAGLHVQGCLQRQCAVTIVFKPARPLMNMVDDKGTPGRAGSPHAGSTLGQQKMLARIDAAGSPHKSAAPPCVSLLCALRTEGSR